MTELDELRLRVSRAKRRIGEARPENDEHRKDLNDILRILEGRNK